jgi:phage repressor protein C with HTH and peptisase S24 domain
MEFSQRLKKIINDSGFNNEALSQKLKDEFGFKISKESIAKYKNGSRTPSPEFIENVLKLTGAKASDIFIGEVKVGRREIKEVPIVGTASCGGADINYLQVEGMSCIINAEKWNEHLYCVIANGDSMSPEIDDGDEVIIDPNIKPINGDMVYYKIDEESAIKVLVVDEDAYILQFVPYNQSENFKTKTIRLDDEDTLNRLSYHKVVSVNKLKYNNRMARLRLIGRA